MGTKRGKGEKSFVRDTRQQAIDFYREIVQDLRPWRAAAPKLPGDDADTTEAREPPPFSAPQERDPGEAPTPTAAT